MGARLIVPGASLREVCEAVEGEIRRRGAELAFPAQTSPDGAEDRLAVGAVLAIEPFATDGLGFVVEQGRPEVFRLPPGQEAGDTDPELLAAIAAKRGLPFSRRDLRAFARPRVEAALAALVARGWLAAYAPLVEASGRQVAQAEHTLYVGPDGVEVLTR